MEIGNFSRFITAGIGIVFCFGTPLAHAANWQFRPSLELVTNYTDNVMLAEPGLEESELILEALPRINIEGEGARSSVSVDYQYQALVYQENPDLNNQFHQLDLSATSELAQELLFLDVAGFYNQQAISATDIPPSNIFISSDRTNVGSYQISPYVYMPLHSNARVLLRPSFGEVKYPDLDNADNVIKQAIAVAEQEPQPSLMGWQVSVQQRVVDFENGEQLDMRRFDFGISIPLSMRSSWFINAGKENNSYELTDGSEHVEDNLWNTGLRWNKEDRTRFLASVGERFFGSTYALDLFHRSRYSSWNVAYNEDLQTSSLQLQPILTVTQARELDMPPLMRGIESVGNEVFISKRFTANVSWQLSKSTITFNAINDQREHRLTDESEDMIGAGVDYTWRFKPRTRAVLRLEGQNRKFMPDDRTENERQFEISALHDLSRRMHATVGYTYATRDSSEEGLDYTYNLYTLSLIAEFM